MARARNIKPGFYKNEQLAECSIWTRYIYPGLWQLADREGRLEDRPKRIKGELLPFDSVDVEQLLTELASTGFIQRYQAEGKRYIQIIAFPKHQNPHHREPPSNIPPPGASPGHRGDGMTAKPWASGTSQGGKTPGQPQESRADSGFLNPESGDKPTVGLPPDGALAGETAKARARREARAAAERAIAYLNAKAGTRFQTTEANLRFPAGRILYDGASEQDLLAVVDLKLAESAKGEFDRKYLRPATLWNAEKFSQYIGQVGVGVIAAAGAKTSIVFVQLQSPDSQLKRCLITHRATGKVDPWDLVKRIGANPTYRHQLVEHTGYVVVETDDNQVLAKYSPREISEGLRA